MNNVTSYFKKKTDFLLSATQPRQHPNVVFPEVAFIGRSNVGKSSLINAIFMKKLAPISNTPGKIQHSPVEKGKHTREIIKSIGKENLIEDLLKSKIIAEG